MAARADFEGNVDVQLGRGPTHTKAALVMKEVPIAMLAGCAPELKGLKLGGLATVSFDADVKNNTSLRGHFDAREARYDKVLLGRVSGDFTLSDGHTVRLTKGHISGPTLTAELSGSATRGGRLLAVRENHLG